MIHICSTPYLYIPLPYEQTVDSTCGRYMSQDENEGKGEGAIILQTFTFRGAASADVDDDEEDTAQGNITIRLRCVPELSLSDGFLLIEENYTDLTGLQVCC